MPRRKKTKVTTEIKRSEKFNPTPLDQIPGQKTSFRKGGTTFTIGDRVLVHNPTQSEEAIEGELTSVLGSQFVVTDPENAPFGKFFFYNGAKLTMIEQKTKTNRKNRRKK